MTDRLRVLGAGSELIKITNKAGTKPKDLAKVKHVRLGKKGKEYALDWGSGKAFTKEGLDLSGIKMVTIGDVVESVKRANDPSVPLRAPTPWHYFSLWTRDGKRTYDFGVSAKDPVTGQYDLSAASRLLMLWATTLQQICCMSDAASLAEARAAL